MRSCVDPIIFGRYFVGTQVLIFMRSYSCVLFQMPIHEFQVAVIVFSHAFLWVLPKTRFFALVVVAKD